METKATRLEKLSEVVTVPPFVRISRQNLLDNSFFLPSWSQYIVRGVGETEDQEYSSRAGQFLSIGPIDSRGVLGAIGTILQDSAITEVIVQEYRHGSSGVAFCFKENDFYIEYSAFPEGVTAGKIRPFVAIVPVINVPRYRNLQEALVKIFNQFGPCDVEFIGVEVPVFVQVRPITSKFEIDREMVKLQMSLQESITGRWIENDVSQAIGEHDDFDYFFTTLYTESLGCIMKKYFNRSINITADDVINVGPQYFVSERFMEMTRLMGVDLLKLVWVFFRERGRLYDTECTNSSFRELFERSILSSMFYTLLKQGDFFLIRERYRQKIDEKLRQKPLRKGALRKFEYDGLLDPLIELDRAVSIWVAIRRRNSQGVWIVSGEFDKAKFYVYKAGKTIPKGAVVLCDYLYPDIGRNIDTIGGVICRNGSINSHVAILCRERNIPLVVQADLDNFMQ